MVSLKSIVSLIILKNPRSGSSWFVQLLNSASRVYVTEEILTSRSDPSKGDYQSYLARALREPMARFNKGPAYGSNGSGPQRSLKDKAWPEDGWAVLGFTVSPKKFVGTSVNVSQFGATVVAYERTNKIKQAVAYYRGRLMRAKCGSNYVRDECRLDDGLINVDLKTFSKDLVESLAKDHALRQHVVDGARRITYEGLIGNPKETLRVLFEDWLHVYDYGRDTNRASLYSKTTSDDLRTVLGNFDEVRQWLNQTAPCLLPHLMETRADVVQSDTCDGAFTDKVEERLNTSRGWRRENRGKTRKERRKKEKKHEKKKNKS